MTKLSILIFFIIGMNLSAKEGVITVLQAPLFEKPDTNSKVVDYLAKGSHITLNKTETEKSDLLNLTEDLEYELPYLEEMESTPTSFYQTFDRRGRLAYLLRKHLVVLHEDEREFTAKAKPIDGTDYRLEEPLPQNYPFKTPTGLRSFFNIGYGNLNRSDYEFETQGLQSFGRRYDFTGGFAKRADFKGNERLYFGAAASFQYATKGTNLGDRTAVQRWLTLGLGPMVMYDPWKSPHKKITLYFSVIANLLYQNQITQQDLETSDVATFNGLSLSPRAGGYLSWSKLALDLDPIIGVNVQSNYTVGQMKGSGATVPEWWPGSTLKGQTGIEVSFFVGIQKSL